MLNLHINIVRSRPIDGSELLRAVERIQTRCRKHDFVSKADGEIHGFPLRVRQLPPLDGFDRVVDITLTAETCNVDKCDAFISMTRQTHAFSASHAWTTWFVAESDLALQGNGKFDLSISAGLRKEGYFSGVYIYRPSPAGADIRYRTSLFDEVIAEMSVSDKIVTQLGDDVLYMRAAVPWQLVYPSHQVPGGGNPLGFYACGFSSVEEALSAGKRLIDRFAKRMFGVGFVTRLPDVGYDAVCSELNSLWQSWDLEVMGSLTADAIDVLKGGEVTAASPSRIPAFEWYGVKDWAAYGSVVIEDGKRYLEIATDGGSLELLQERVAFLSDVRFEPVFPRFS